MPASPAQISITVDGEKEFDREFSRADATFDDLRPIWPDVRKEFWKIESEQFSSEGGKGGSGRWKPLSPQYKKAKIRRYGAGKKILEASGRLVRSLTGENEGSYYYAGKREVALGTTVPYGIYHQRGGGNLPKREPISFSTTQKERLMKVIQAALIRELRRGAYYVPPSER